MLSHEENELLCRIGAGTPMGDYVRRYWIPALKSDELAPGSDPKRVRLLGEDLVAFRTVDGTVGLLDENCPHRGASLALARAEGCALRCLYHGWLIDAAGRILETPPEPEELGFRERIFARRYPTRELGGIVWAYLGPAAVEPELQAFDFCALPSAQVEILKVRIDCNWTQVLEGVLDSAHTNYLHRDGIRSNPNASAQNEFTAGSLDISRPSADGQPRIDVRKTPYGFRYAAIRKPIVDPETKRFIRVTLFIAPFYGMIPAPKGWGNIQAMVPVDDEHTMFYYFKYHREQSLSGEERVQHQTWSGIRPGVDVIDPVTFAKRQTHANNWLQDRERMRRGESYSGITGVNVEDFAVEESMGPIYDRRKEHLATSDAAVIRMRRMLIDASRALRDEGRPPIGLGCDVPWGDLRAEDGMLAIEAPWYEILSVAGDSAVAER